MRKNRQCSCCGTQYTYCPDCGGADRLKPTWYADFCCEDCKELWLTATKFNMNLMTKQEAAEIISHLSLKDKTAYVACVQKDLENIFAKEDKNKAAKKAEAHEVVNKTEEIK